MPKECTTTEDSCSGTASNNSYSTSLAFSWNGFNLPFKPSALGYKFVLTVTDYFNKYVEAIPIPDKSADSVAKGIYKI